MSDSFVPGLRYRTDADELWALVVESYGGWEGRMNEASAAVRLSPVSAWALVQLDPEHAMSQRELAGRLQCNPSTVVDSTDRLERAGYVTRSSKPGDRRVNSLKLTDAGRAAREQLVDRLFEPPAAFRNLSAADQARFRDAMLAAVSEARSQTMTVVTDGIARAAR